MCPSDAVRAQALVSIQINSFIWIVDLPMDRNKCMWVRDNYNSHAIPKRGVITDKHDIKSLSLN